jgi:hypothetical protein
VLGDKTASLVPSQMRLIRGEFYTCNQNSTLNLGKLGDVLGEPGDICVLKKYARPHRVIFIIAHLIIPTP